MSHVIFSSYPQVISYEVEPHKDFWYGTYMKKVQFATDSIYHLYNRGVEKRKVFMDNDDHFRFIHDLYEFNDEESAVNIYYKRAVLISYEVQPRKRSLLVEIIAFCLMPNHFHLLVRQRQNNGIIKFMQKLGTGYTMFFNQKNNRVGSLFQGRFKAVLVENQSHFLYLPHYIHLNPLDLKVPSWRQKRVENVPKALQYLESYRWSSYADHIGKTNFPSVISSNLFKKFYGTPKTYHQSLTEWINNMDIGIVGDVALENISSPDILRG